MKSTISLGLTSGLIASAIIILSAEILVSNSYAPIKEDVKVGLANRFEVAANEVEDRGSEAAQKLRDQTDELDEPPVDIKVELRDAASKVEDHTSNTAQGLRDKASQILQPTD